MEKFSVAIIGGGISGWMMAKRITMRFPDADITIFDKSTGEGGGSHPFHLHRLITDIPALAELKPAVLKTNVWDGEEFKSKRTILDINDYSRKLFPGEFQVTNINNVEDLTIYPITKGELLRCFQDVKGRVRMVNSEVTGVNSEQKTVHIEEGMGEYNYIVNTIPLPTFLKLANIDHSINFQPRPFYTAVVGSSKSTMLYQMCYNSDCFCNITRTTLLDDTLFIELKDDQYTEEDKRFLHALYSITDPPPIRKLSPGRFIPVPREERKVLFHYLTEKFNIFCLGRYGTWSYKVAVDVWEDSEFITNIIYVKEQAKKFKEV
jgi:hypothetical protein